MFKSQYLFATTCIYPHTCVMDKVISSESVVVVCCCLHKNSQISRSRLIASDNWQNYVENGKTVTSLCSKCFIGHPY